MPLFDDKIDVFRTVLKFAEEQRLANDQYGLKSGSLAQFAEYMKTPEFAKVHEKREALENYLNSLDFEDVKILQTIMYLGRDRDYDKEAPAEKRYFEQRQSMDLQGWDTQVVEVNQMVEKLPLDSYLRSGMEILGIAI